MDYQRLKKKLKSILKPKFRWINEFYYFHDLKNIREDIRPKIAIDVRMIDASEIKLLHEIWEVDLEKMLKRLELGHSECFVAFHENLPVGYQWIQNSGKHWVQQAGEWINIRANRDFMIYHARVDYAFRSNGINSFVKNEILKIYRRRGYDRALVYTMSTNIPNQKGLEKLGFKKVFNTVSLSINTWIYVIRGKADFKKYLQNSNA